MLIKTFNMAGRLNWTKTERNTLKNKINEVGQDAAIKWFQETYPGTRTEMAVRTMSYKVMKRKPYTKRDKGTAGLMSQSIKRHPFIELLEGKLTDTSTISFPEGKIVITL